MVQNYFFSSGKNQQRGLKNGDIILDSSRCVYWLEFSTAMVGTIYAGKNSFNVEGKNKRLNSSSQLLFL